MDILQFKDYKGYEVCIRPDENYGYFESNSDDEFDYVEGGLWFEDGELVDFDGCGILPEEVGEAINELGYKCNLEDFCE